MARRKMTSDERLRTFLSNQKVDRVPFIPFILGYCHRLSTCKLGDIYADPGKSFKAQMEAREIHGYEGFPFYGYSSYGAWEFGGEIAFPYGEFDQAPKIKKHPLKGPEEIEKLEVPDVRKAGIIPRMMEFSKLQERYGMPITVHNGSPFSRIGNVIELSTALKMLIKSPDLVHLLMRKITDFCLRVTEYWVEEFGPERIISFDGTPVESEQLLSPKQFEEFAFPYLKEMHQKVTEMGIRIFWTHLCGGQENNLPLLAELPYGKPGIVSLSEQIDLELGHRYFGQKYAIAGNINPQIIQMGSCQEVFEATRKALLTGKEFQNGFVLMGGCEIPPTVPPINIHYMMKAVEEFGYYE